MLNHEQVQKSRQFIFRTGRLLERQLCEYFFGAGTIQACMRALLAYQNADGGFGNGIEPDLLCPDSTAIGAETAMCVMDILDCHGPEVTGPLLEWIVRHQDPAGFIRHPPADMFNYPYQPWWKNPDMDRVLMLAGLLKKWGVERDTFFQRVRGYYERAETPSADAYYGYPHFVYLKYCGETLEDRTRFATMVERLPVLLERCADHFPLLHHAWSHAAGHVSQETLAAEAQKYVAALQEDGGLAAPYPELPWWRPVWTLDGLILLKRYSFLKL
jgi:hypothetical protein